MNPIQINIPVKEYLKKYIYALENLEYDTPIDITRGGSIPSVIGVIFEAKTKAIPHQGKPDDERFDSSLPILLNIRRINDGHVVITPERIRWLHSFLFKSFHDHLLTRILVLRSVGTNEVDVIHEFMRELDIIDDITFDALKKASYRLRKVRKIPIFNQRNSKLAV